ncbi:MAG: trypsin-like peptidase domain-containing protein [Planctomycetaceae bacterium]|nr:trypsin-like peptidase domain-containing protein [Planctomycetaceae bacterium]
MNYSELKRSLLCFMACHFLVDLSHAFGLEQDDRFDMNSAKPNLSQVWKPQQIVAGLNLEIGRLERGAPDPSGSFRPRGEASMRVYRDASPAIVMVTDGKTGHGTGFFIREGGWIMTNHHVVESMPIDPTTGAKVARVVVGRLADDGAMSAHEEHLEAIVYRTDEIRDLALLRLTDVSAEIVADHRSIPLADQSPVPGTLCIAIGHPAQGVMWTLRQGEVSGRGQFPKDQLGNFVLRGADTSERESLEDLLGTLPSRKVLLSSCGLNPGDSGGPLLNEAGHLIAVSFAVPTIDAERGIDLGKFSYHVHLEEVKSFLEDWPSEPAVAPPSILPPAFAQALVDMDDDNQLESWLFALDASTPSGFLVDLDADSDPDFIKRALADGITDTEPLQTWNWEFAYVLAPQELFAFELDGDGHPDVVFVQQELGPDHWNKFSKSADGIWKCESWEGDPQTHEHFESAEMQRQFRRIMRRLR